VPEKLYPIRYIAGVALFLIEPEFSTKERARELGHQFLGCVFIRAEAIS
jgi:hypothetical protein